MDFSIRKNISSSKRPFPRFDLVDWLAIGLVLLGISMMSFVLAADTYHEVPTWKDGRTFNDRVKGIEVRRNTETGQPDRYDILTETSGNYVSLGRNEAESREQAVQIKVGQAYNFRYVLGASTWTIYRYDPK